MRVLGKYRLLELLASGGMADVWRAEVTGAAGVTKEVALKLVRGEHEASSDFVRMFVEEARLASRLGHANVVQVFEFGLVEGRYYIAMELVRGYHLGRVVERARELGVRLGLARAVHVGVEVAKGLAHAHRKGCVHRDVSPHNVLVSFEGEVKLADFGIARALGQAGLTAPGTVKGKVAYMAPEQARAGEVDARADLFSLGVMLWELCAGRRLFARESEAATLAAVLSDDPLSPPSAWNEAVPPRLDAAVAALLARDPAARTATADEAVAGLSGVLLELARTHDDVDLRALLARLFPEGPGPAAGAEATRVRAGPPPEFPVASGIEESDAPDEGGDETTRTAPATRRARRWRAVAAGAVVTALLASAGLLFRPGAPVPEPVPAPSPAAPPAAPAATSSGPGAAAPVPPGAVAGPEAPAVESSPVRPDARPPNSPGREPEQRRRPVVSASSESLGRLPLPSAASGEGLLAITTTPWAAVWIDGQRVSDSTPVELRLAAGEHRVTMRHPQAGSASVLVRVTAGERSTLQRELKRR